MQNTARLIDFNPTDGDEAIHLIKDLINSKQLEAGDRLPSERKLSEKFNISRSQVRSAIQKLEFYGLLKTLPQSGTVVASIGITAINGMMRDILNLQSPDFKSLVEARIVLEKSLVELASIKRSEKDLLKLEIALNAFETKLLNGGTAVEEDMMFHLKIAEASGNSALHSLMMVITPEIITFFTKNKICDKVEAKKLVQQHTRIFKAIKAQDPTEAVLALETHLSELKNYCAQ